MATRRFVFVAALSLGAASLLGIAPLQAQQINQPDVANTNYQVTGTINAEQVNVRSGPSENYYPTMKLEKGTTVTVVGQKGDWLKILPPEGSFCYVAKAYVERRGDGSKGRVTKPDLLVHPGSSLNDMKYVNQTKLNADDDVVILGEKDEYYMIQPPPGAYLFISKQYVDPVKAAPALTPAVAGNTAPAPSTAPVAGNIATPAAPAEPTTPAAPTTQGTENAVVTETPESVASKVAAAEAEFDKLEGQYKQAVAQPLEAEPLKDLLASYQTLLANDKLPVSMRRLGEARVKILTSRSADQADLLSAQKSREEFLKKQQVLKAEQEELAQRIKENEVQVFTAVGALQASSLQQGAGTLYRLTDPANGHTLVYVRSGEANVNALLGQFVGVRGDVSQDSQLQIKVIAPTAVETVDPAKVYKNVAAQIVPPSLLPKAPATAPTAGEQ